MTGKHFLRTALVVSGRRSLGNVLGCVACGFRRLASSTSDKALPFIRTTGLVSLVAPGGPSSPVGRVQIPPRHGRLGYAVNHRKSGFAADDARNYSYAGG